MAKSKNSAGRYRHEYRKHLHKNAFPMILYLIAFMIVSIALIILTLVINRPLEYNSLNIQKCKYDYAIETEDNQSVFRQNYKLENLVTFSSAGRRINVNTYLDSDNGIIKAEGVLEKNEIIISHQIADELNVIEGDQIQVELPIYDTSSEYYVKKIIPYVSNYYSISDNYDFGVAFLGYDDKIESQAKGNNIVFLTDAEYLDFSQSGISYSQRYDVRNEIEIIDGRFALYSTISLLILFVIICTYHIIISKSISNEIIKYCNDSFSLKVIKGYYFVDGLLYLAIPLVILCIIGFVVYSSLYYILGYALICGFWMVWWIIGGKRFEKAS